jgi:hypothetical protein
MESVRQPVTDPDLIQRDQILKGYAAFNEDEPDVLRTLLHPNVKWHPLESDDVIEGVEAVLAELARLRRVDKNEAVLLGVASHETTCITLDVTSKDGELDHACADKITFDADGKITEVWHCLAGSHDH